MHENDKTPVGAFRLRPYNPTAGAKSRSYTHTLRRQPRGSSNQGMRLKLTCHEGGYPRWVHCYDRNILAEVRQLDQSPHHHFSDEVVSDVTRTAMPSPLCDVIEVPDEMLRATAADVSAWLSEQMRLAEVRSKPVGGSPPTGAPQGTYAHPNPLQLTPQPPPMASKTADARRSQEQRAYSQAIQEGLAAAVAEANRPLMALVEQLQEQNRLQQLQQAEMQQKYEAEIRRIATVQQQSSGEDRLMSLGAPAAPAAVAPAPAEDAGDVEFRDDGQDEGAVMDDAPGDDSSSKARRRRK